MLSSPSLYDKLWFVFSQPGESCFNHADNSF